MSVVPTAAGSRARHAWRASYALPALLLIGLVIGVLTVRQYGESWDELQFFKYADRALQAYSTWPSSGTIPLTGNTYDNYGPAYVMLVALAARLLGLILPWITSDLRHLAYVITWLVCLWAFHALARRWLMEAAAFGATLLFATQPLFWGHAFISPKDIPFLTFFLLSLEFGFRMVDARPSISLDSLSPERRRLLPALTALWLVVLFAAFVLTPVIHAWIGDLVTAAAAGQTNIVSRLASDIHRIKPAVYTERYFVFFLWVRSLFFLLSGLVLAWLWRRVTSLRGFLLAVIPAAVLLGITTSMRVLGPFAGLIIVGYAIWQQRREAVATLLAYFLLAVVTMYLTWPYLWPDPVGHLVESVRVMSEYPWRGQVLFDGAMYASTNLPRLYLPVLLGIQLTEPVWFLFAAGLVIAVLEAVRKRRQSMALLALSILWFVLPLLGFVATRSPLYDNFRQVFFILPPVFLLGGLALERIRHPLLQAAVIGLLVLPGIIDGVRLHPYEYIYYNRFIGGVSGAFRKYELDYWGTSYREATAYLDQVAPANGTVWVEGPAHLVQLYARPDIKIYSTDEAARASHYDYVISTTRYNLDLASYPEAAVVHVIERDGSPLTVIKKP
ncbi:MAG TPA: hypothetical protein VF784_17780 [Anaerolineales bacterium]